MSRACVVVGRMLILFSAVLAIVMPWTENFWHFDKFPYGGDDFELSVFFDRGYIGAGAGAHTARQKKCDIHPCTGAMAFAGFLERNFPGCGEL